MTFWELVGEAALTWAFYGVVIVMTSVWGAICGEEWRASGFKFREGWLVLKGWLGPAFLFLMLYFLTPLWRQEPDAALALGAFAANSLIYFLAASGGGPVADYWRNAGFFEAR